MWNCQSKDATGSVWCTSVSKNIEQNPERKKDLLVGCWQEEAKDQPDPIAACTILILRNSHECASEKDKKNSPCSEWPKQGALNTYWNRRKELRFSSAAHLSAATVSDGSKVLVSTLHRHTRPSSIAPSSLYLLPSIMYYTTNRTFLQVFSQN